ncbi:MAG: hypothetical protein FWE02_04255 [Defluviitaleaceae bacterium]|nr:hypothetical protein [Defluviitaleaceae bacterium]
MRNIFRKLAYPQLFIPLFSLIILALIIMATFRLFAYFYEDYIITASGRKNLEFNVFYLENDLFHDNPVPSNLDFLMSYTDYIEIYSNFTADFSTIMEVYYDYRSEKRVIIRYIGSDDHGFVFEERFPLNETRGQMTTNNLRFGAVNDGNPGGVYTIFPKDYIELYFEFVENQTRQMEEEGILARGLRGFSAELWIEFRYSIRSPETGLNEMVTQGVRIPLTTEIYSFMMTGSPSFDWQTNLTIRDAQITLPMSVLFVASFALSLFGLLYNIKKATEDPNVYKQEVKNILKKYVGEIVIYDKPTIVISE